MKSGTFYELAYITEVAAESETLLHFPYQPKFIFRRRAILLQSSQALLIFLYSIQN